MAQRTIGAILNEASDNVSRDAETSRRAALTNVSLKGELANQRYREAEFADKEGERARANEYREELRKIYDKHLFRDVVVPSQQPGAIPDANGNFPSQQTVRESYQPGSKEWMKGLSDAMAEKSSLDLRFGLAKPEDMTQMLEFRKKLEETGTSDDFLAAMRGDKGAAGRIAERFGINGLQSIESGYDENGLLNFFAMTQGAGPGGAMESRRVPIGHLMAAFSPDIERMLKANREQVNATDALATSATSRRNDTTRAQASATQAQAAMIEAGNSEQRLRLQGTANRYAASSLLSDKVNRRKFSLPLSEIGPTGKAEEIPDAEAPNIVTNVGDMFISRGGQEAEDAFNSAVTMLGGWNNQTMADYDKAVRDARARLEAAKRDGNSEQRRAASTALGDLEDNSVQWFQRQRRTYIERWEAEINKATQQPAAQPAPQAAIPTR